MREGLAETTRACVSFPSAARRRLQVPQVAAGQAGQRLAPRQGHHELGPLVLIADVLVGFLHGNQPHHVRVGVALCEPTTARCRAAKKGTSQCSTAQ
jgi:hypothetical protein